MSSAPRQSSTTDYLLSSRHKLSQHMNEISRFLKIILISPYVTIVFRSCLRMRICGGGRTCTVRGGRLSQERWDGDGGKLSCADRAGASGSLTRQSRHRHRSHCGPLLPDFLHLPPCACATQPLPPCLPQPARGPPLRPSAYPLLPRWPPRLLPFTNCSLHDMLVGINRQTNK